MHLLKRGENGAKNKKSVNNKKKTLITSTFTKCIFQKKHGVFFKKIKVETSDSSF